MHRDDISKEFNLQTFKQLVTGLVETELYSEAKDIQHNSSLIKSAQNIGHFLDNRFNNVLVITHSATVSARVKLATDTFKLMAENNIDKALVAYVSVTDEKEWRFSFISISLEEVKGKVKKTFSNPRRYSYVLGPRAKTATPYNYLISKDKVNSLEELQKRFSLEVVNREFYKYIASLYQALVGSEKTPLNSEELRIIEQLSKVVHVSTESGTKYYSVDKLLKYPGSVQESHEFSVRLIGRIIFCWFLREKRSEAGKPLIPIEILSRTAASQDNYYHTVLAPLFFEVLNKPLKNRSNKFTKDDYDKIPFLNGGLFSDDSIDHYKFDKTLELSIPGLIEVPDKWLHQVFDLLERFNFTVDENTSYDTDLSIDPEMLGRVFENLLARINPETGETVRRSTGSFYTPREIVEYMVDCSLVRYLEINTPVPKDKLEALVSYDLSDDSGNELTDSESESVLEALSNLTILDPACGSGAYPMGILQKIVHVISILDPSANWWLAKQLAGASPELRREYENKGVDYIRKLGIIRQTIFGVDIQPIATEISRLRCFLTLIVDEAIDDSQENRGIRPLPNLEFKFVTANTLLPLPEQRYNSGHIQQDMFDNSQQAKIDKLRYLIDEFFSASAAEKSEIKAEYRYIQNQLWNDMHKSSSYGQQSLALTGWDPFEHTPSGWFDPSWMYGVSDGFDIVIGNPPYVSTEKINEPEKTQYKKIYADIHASRTDIYTYFYKRGIDLSKQSSGLLCYITSNKWLRAGYGQKTRELIHAKNALSLIDFGGFQVFESAAVDTNILLVQNEPGAAIVPAAHFKNDFVKNKTSIKEYFNDKKIDLVTQKDEAWFISDASEIKLKRRIESLGSPLSKQGRKISRGVISGFNEAFIIDGHSRNILIDQDASSNDIIKPLLRGRDIKRFGYEHDDKYIIAVGFGMYKDLQKRYPAVYKHLLKYEIKLKKRGQCKSSRSGKRISVDYEGQHHWLELDNNPSQSYFNEFESEKIMWPETMRIHRTTTPNFPRFCIKEPGVYLDKTVFMMDYKRPKFFIGLINSKLGWKIIDFYVDKLDNGGYMMQKAMVENLPIPDPNSLDQELVDELENYVDKCLALRRTDINGDIAEYEDRMNEIVYQIYNLTEEEIGIVESVTGSS